MCSLCVRACACMWVCVGVAGVMYFFKASELKSCVSKNRDSYCVGREACVCVCMYVCAYACVRACVVQSEETLRYIDRPKCKCRPMITAVCLVYRSSILIADT